MKATRSFVALLLFSFVARSFAGDFDQAIQTAAETDAQINTISSFVDARHKENTTLEAARSKTLKEIADLLTKISGLNAKNLNKPINTNKILTKLQSLPSKDAKDTLSANAFLGSDDVKKHRVTNKASQALGAHLDGVAKGTKADIRLVTPDDVKSFAAIKDAYAGTLEARKACIAPQEMEKKTAEIRGLLAEIAQHETDLNAFQMTVDGHAKDLAKVDSDLLNEFNGHYGTTAGSMADIKVQIDELYKKHHVDLILKAKGLLDSQLALVEPKDLSDADGTIKKLAEAVLEKPDALGQVFTKQEDGKLQVSFNGQALVFEAKNPATSFDAAEIRKEALGLNETDKAKKHIFYDTARTHVLAHAKHQEEVKELSARTATFGLEQKLRMELNDDLQALLTCGNEAVALDSKIKSIDPERDTLTADGFVKMSDGYKALRAKQAPVMETVRKGIAK